LCSFLTEEQKNKDVELEALAAKFKQSLNFKFSQVTQDERTPLLSDAEVNSLVAQKSSMYDSHPKKEEIITCMKDFFKFYTCKQWTDNSTLVKQSAPPTCTFTDGMKPKWCGETDDVTKYDLETNAE